ncbi:hypothetical protein HPB49_015590 [Dermacentor silvarum]|uniref:Uncharacterized protein n=1 Tax=Dermacentor silvarum TaxID=543639 RepID=A0ACB8DEQ4_DERSI|nr:hypothetical protein HPB49_015590 [Dermacentor silvarum]
MERLKSMQAARKRLEKSSNELTKISGKLPAEMSDDEVAADFDSSLDYEKQVAGVLGLLRHHILELCSCRAAANTTYQWDAFWRRPQVSATDPLGPRLPKLDRLRERTAHGPLEVSSRHYRMPRFGRRKTPASSAAVLKNSAIGKCVFCAKHHATSECYSASDHNEKRRLLMASDSCFRCTTKGHRAQHCRRKISCTHCAGRHASSMF